MIQTVVFILITLIGTPLFACALDSDCYGKEVCLRSQCVAPSQEETTANSFCQYDYECGSEQMCQNASCKPRVSFDETAIDACGNDRRCRIDRIKRLNAARRHVEQIGYEARLKEDLARVNRERAKEKPRQYRPFVFGLMESRLGPLPGVYIGWTFNGSLRITADYQFTEKESFANGVDSFAETHFWTGALEYFLVQNVFSPYFRGGFKLGSGTFDNFSFGTLGGFSSNVDSVYHAAELGAGFDIQLVIGMHARLGLVYRPLLYSQAKIEPGVYDALAKTAMDDLFNSQIAFDVIGAFGWAF